MVSPRDVLSERDIVGEHQQQEGDARGDHGVGRVSELIPENDRESEDKSPVQQGDQRHAPQVALREVFVTAADPAVQKAQAEAVFEQQIHRQLDQHDVGRHVLPQLRRLGIAEEIEAQLRPDEDRKG